MTQQDPSVPLSFPREAFLLSPEEAWARRDRDVRFIDVRPAAAFAASRIPGAVAMPDTEITVRYREVLALDEIIVYGSGEEGDISACIAEVFRSHLDHPGIFALAGGFKAWQAAGLPVDTAPAEVPPSPVAVQLPWQEIDVVEAYCRQGQGATLVDVRELFEFMQGHPAGARHIPMSQIQLYLEELDQMRPLLLICNSGNRSGVIAEWLVRHGFPRQDVANVMGGVIAWQVRRLPWER
jgi:rhodanese-related sulfurtransferase